MSNGVHKNEWTYQPHPTHVNVFDVYDPEGQLYFGLPEKIAKDFCKNKNLNEANEKRIKELEAFVKMFKDKIGEFGEAKSYDLIMMRKDANKLLTTP